MTDLNCLANDLKEKNYFVIFVLKLKKIIKIINKKHICFAVRE